MSHDLKRFYEKALKENDIPAHLYKQYDVKKGLRNEDGTGVLVGLTTIADVIGYQWVDGKKVDCKGDLLYRGISIHSLVHDKKQNFIFEEVCFLILFGYRPEKEELEVFKNNLKSRYALPHDFLSSNILRHPAKNLMNKLQQDILALYAFDEDPDAIDPFLTLDKGLNLLARIFSIAIYDYVTKLHYFNQESLHVHQVNPNYGIAENILHLLRTDSQFTKEEAIVLDTLLVLHADHGGGNNSTFTNVVISSTNTDIYSAFVGSIGSLKGPRHGGANLAAKQMMEKVIEKIGLEASDVSIKEIIQRILSKDFHDKTGLVYGMGHAIYTLSDPRSELMANECKKLAIQKRRIKEFEFYQRFDRIAVETIKEIKGVQVCSNFDFYSGLAYDMLSIPEDLYPLLFVVSRSVGWLAHNIENKLYCDRIIRPATKYVG